MCLSHGAVASLNFKCCIHVAFSESTLNTYFRLLSHVISMQTMSNDMLPSVAVVTVLTAYVQPIYCVNPIKL